MALTIFCCAVSARAESGIDPGASAPAVSDPGPANPRADTPRHKSIAATVLLSLVIPGGGNFYTGQLGKGFLALGAGVAGAALMSSAVNDSCTTTSRYFICSTDTSTGKLYGGLGIMGAAHVYDLITALHRAEDINNGKVSSLERLRLSFPTAGKRVGVKVAYQFDF